MSGDPRPMGRPPESAWPEGRAPVDMRPTGYAAGGTRSWPIAGTVVGVALMIAALAVMTAVGVHAAQLGDSPSWTFDCNDTTCVDLWADARRHYLVTTGVAMVSGIAGWVLVGALRPPGPHGAGVEAPGPVGAGSQETGQRRAEPRPRRMVPAAFGFLAVILWPTFLHVGILPLLVVSRPAAAAGICAAGALAALMLWWDLRSHGGEDRSAWFWAGMTVVCGAVAVPLGLLLGMVAVFAASAVGVSLNLPAAGLHTALMPMLFLAGMPVGITVMALARRQLRLREDPSDDPVLPERRSSGPQRFLPALLAITLVAVIGSIAVWAARPVDVLPADAWRYGAEPGSDDPGPGPASPSADGDRASPGEAGGSAAPGTDSGGDTGPDSESTPTPVDVPAEIPDCRPDQVNLSIGGWDGVTGNSYAVLRAHSVATEPCALRGRPELVITQGGDPIDLRHEPLAGEEHLQDPALGAVLEPGATAHAALFWPGYRTAADQETPQSAEVILADGAEPVPVLLETTAGYGIDPAPFDLKDGVNGGAEIQVGVWVSEG
ncbi:DUF4232 domain-containing protein [Brachybacterium muris]|uniref:DUF4232 domain-containing protein n=1 Tax=Brachybacterium muris TaxID=219301 RepID=UPI00223BCFED|nr:DUF4232 domain-containing protein [Brachybacterium muris]MCT2260677.1 DUF4232 domain-containing protein [Brachybacterium muris]